MLSSPDELRAIRSPLAYRILAAVESLGEASAAEVADHVGRRVETLYYHLHRLVKVGILTRDGDDESGRSAARYRTVGAVVVDRECREPEFLAALGGVYRTALRAAERQLDRALELEATETGPRSATDVRQWNVRLDEESLARVRGLVSELTRLLADRAGATDGRAYSVTTVLSRSPEVAREPAGE